MPQRSRWALPEVIDPPKRRCITVHVPDERNHIAAFYGAMFELAKAYSWENDSGHSAVQVASVWRDIWYQLVFGPCGGNDGQNSTEIEDIVGIRVDCDCRVWITCCDGTEKELVTKDMIDKPSQPSDGTRPPVGGSHQDCYKLDANGQLLLPYVVYPGDVISLTGASGAGNDGGTAEWYCVDGEQFFAGTCGGFPHTDGGDPLPSVNHMRLIFKIGSSYVDAMAGPVTVSGSGAQEVSVQVNDSGLSNNAGSYAFCVEVTNNQTASTFSHFFDFTLGSYGWILNSVNGITRGAFTGGVGFTPTDAGPDSFASYYHGESFKRTFASRTITKLEITFDWTAGSINNPATDYGVYTVINNGPGVDIKSNLLSNGNGQVKTWTGSQVGTEIEMLLDDAVGTTPPTPGSSRIISLLVEGNGTDPF